MINDVSSISLASGSPRILRSAFPSAKADLPKEVSSGDIMRAAHALRKEHALSMGEAMAWAHQCVREWRKLVEERAAEACRASFRRFKHRRNCGKLVDAVEVVGYRPGITRASLNRQEKIAENERLLSKGLEPKYLTY